MEPCKVCQFWARDASNEVGEHHPHCPLKADPKRTVKARKVEVFDAEGGAVNGLIEEPGVCQPFPEDKRLGFCCPGCGKWGAVRVGSPKPVASPSWNIVSGTLEEPESLTLTPSIHCIGCCGWHGYLTSGIFVPC